MNDKPELKPCPAGHEALIDRDDYGAPEVIFCGDGMCRWVMERAIGQSSQELIDMWNTRAEPQDLGGAG